MLKNKIFVFFIIGICILSFCTCAGILYPKVVFSFKPIGEYPPYSAIDRFEMGDKFSQEIMLWIHRTANELKTSFDMTVFVKQQYKILHIKEMKLVSMDYEKILLKDAKFRLPEAVSETGSKPGHYFGKNGFYWTLKLKPVDKNKGQPHINLEKIFTDKKVGDVFTCKVEIAYVFDNEPEKTLVYDYRVTAVKGKYLSPFYF